MLRSYATLLALGTGELALFIEITTLALGTRRNTVCTSKIAIVFLVTILRDWADIPTVCASKTFVFFLIALVIRRTFSLAARACKACRFIFGTNFWRIASAFAGCTKHFARFRIFVAALAFFTMIAKIAACAVAKEDALAFAAHRVMGAFRIASLHTEIAAAKRIASFARTIAQFAFHIRTRRRGSVIAIAPYVLAQLMFSPFSICLVVNADPHTTMQGLIRAEVFAILERYAVDGATGAIRVGHTVENISFSISHKVVICFAAQGVANPLRAAST